MRLPSALGGAGQGSVPGARHGRADVRNLGKVVRPPGSLGTNTQRERWQPCVGILHPRGSVEVRKSPPLHHPMGGR